MNVIFLVLLFVFLFSIRLKKDFTVLDFQVHYIFFSTFVEVERKCVHCTHVYDAIHVCLHFVFLAASAGLR